MKKTTDYPAQRINEIAFICKGLISSMERLRLMQKIAASHPAYMPMSDHRVVILCSAHMKKKKKNGKTKKKN